MNNKPAPTPMEQLLEHIKKDIAFHDGMKRLGDESFKKGVLQTYRQIELQITQHFLAVEKSYINNLKIAGD